MTTQTNISHLLKFLNLSDLALKNRVALAPMTRGRSGVDRIPNSLMAEYYNQRAGAGLIITEGTTISPQANSWQHTPGIYTPEQTQAWKQVVEVVNSKDTPIFVQLWHTGRASHRSFQENNQLPVAPSAIKIEGAQSHTPKGKQSYETPRALTTETPII